MGIYANPDAAYSLRIIALREIVAKAELIGVLDGAGNLQQHPLEGDDG